MVIAASNFFVLCNFFGVIEELGLRAAEKGRSLEAGLAAGAVADLFLRMDSIGFDSSCCYGYKCLRVWAVNSAVL